VISWGLQPAYVTGDSWYSSVKNLKAIKNHQCGFLFGLESNRLVSVEKGVWMQVQTLDILEQGIVVWLREFGQIKLFRTNLKDQIRHYAVVLPNQDTPTEQEQWDQFTQTEFNQLHDQHWQIEQYHRTLKQVCNIENFQVRNKVAVMNHLFSAICAYAQLRRMCVAELIRNCYQLQRNLFNEVIAGFINAFAPTMNHLNPQFCGAVNA
jgi:hypothetical protein